MSQKHFVFEPDSFKQLIAQVPDSSPLREHLNDGTGPVKVQKKEIYSIAETEGHEALKDFIKTTAEKNKKDSAGKENKSTETAGINADNDAENNAFTTEQEGTRAKNAVTSTNKEISEKLSSQLDGTNPSEKSSGLSKAYSVSAEQSLTKNIDNSTMKGKDGLTGKDSRKPKNEGRSLNKTERNAFVKNNKKDFDESMIQTTVYPEVITTKAVKSGSNGSAQEPTPELKIPLHLRKESNPLQWKNIARAVAGKSHNRTYPPIPCQDSAISIVHPRAAVIACDGAGSSKFSHFGSSAVTEALATLLVSLEDINKLMLDSDSGTATIDERIYVTLWLRHSVESIRRTAVQFGHPFSEFRSTLLLAIAGKKRMFWLRVGDGSIIFEKNNSLYQPCPPIKGEHANETSFLSERILSSEFSFGFEDAEGITGLLVCSDGAAERLISTDGKKIAGSISTMFSDLRTAELSPEDLFAFLTNTDAWKGTSGDDKCIALVSAVTE